ncbi:piggyBac transposable element-derived protein 4-like [Palaemon carinicauda]|uniref:piggyBac transposable element-derived protein 4-like n=1 Tax=Palaemon carinicauda TaxID=392227 RepID=UPI0035B642FD
MYLKKKEQYESIATSVILTPPKHICDADTMPSTSTPPPIIKKKRHLQNLTPSKFLPMLFSEDETDEDIDDDINCCDSDIDGGDIEESEDVENEIVIIHSIREGNIQSYIWSLVNNFIPDIHPFDGNCAGIKNEWPCDGTARETECFLALFNEELVDLIVCEINKYYQLVMEKFSFTQNSQVQKWMDTDVHEIYVYLSLLLLMPLMKKKPVLQDYWKQDPLIPTPFFSKFITRDRFLLLTCFMHFAYNGRPIASDRIWKIRSFFSLVVANFKRVFHPFQKIVIDESLILFKGRLVFKQYIPSKRHRFGIKLFVLCDCETGIVLDIKVYIGTDIDIPKEDQGSGLGFSGAVVMKMRAPYIDHGHILYCILTIGDIVNTGKVHYRTKKKICKPDVIVDYNENMRLVDKSDCQLSETECMRKSFKWYHKIILDLIDITMLNAYNIWLVKTSDPTCKQLKFREFIFNVSYQLLENSGTVTSSRLGRRGHPPGEVPNRLQGAANISYYHLQHTIFDEAQNR